MKNLHCFLLSMAMAILVAAASAQQQGPGSVPSVTVSFPPSGRVLNDDQRQSLRQIVASQRDQMRPLEQQLRT